VRRLHSQEHDGVGEALFLEDIVHRLNSLVQLATEPHEIAL
jgi:hypothetical protein